MQYIRFASYQGNAIYHIHIKSEQGVKDFC
jgi:hypothetical protein